MSIREEVRLLQEVPLFAGTHAAHLQLLVFSAEKFDIDAGEYLFRQGEKTGSGWLISRGAAEAWLDHGGRPERVARLEAGAFAGELAMIADLPHRVSVRALSPLSGRRIPHELFMRVCSEFSEFGQQVLANLTADFSMSMAELNRVRELFERARSFQPQSGSSAREVDTAPISPQENR